MGLPVIGAILRTRDRMVRRAREEAGFMVVEVLAATVVLAVGIGAVFTLMVVASNASQRNKVSQTETSLARELTEDARSLAYTQLTSSGIAAALQPTVPGATLSGSDLTVTRTNGSATGTSYTFTASFTACSLDDPADGYGSHSAPPISGGSWCPDVSGTGTSDTNPDDYKRVSVIVTPQGKTSPSIQQTILVYAKTTHGPAVSCLSVDTTCPGANQQVTGSLSSLPFNVTTTTTAASVQWLVNGSPPPGGQLGNGLDPYAPGGTASTFTWYFPTTTFGGQTYTIDGTYTISALAFDTDGNQGTTSSLQVTVNEHMALPPATVQAGWNPAANGVDVQWVPSVDQDVQYYTVYRQEGTTGTPEIVPGCSQVTGLTCTDTSASSPGVEPAVCVYGTTADTAGVYQLFTTPAYYWIVGVDTSGGSPRASTIESTQVDANRCDHAPSAPTNPSASSSGGSVTLSWSLPAVQDPDPGDSIQQWRIYRWPVGGTMSDPGSRYDLIGEKDESNNDVTTYTDKSPDPGGVQQNYCITAVDTDLQESSCSSPTVSG